MINIRQMGDAGERNVTIVAWYSLGTGVLALLGCIGNWVTPDPRQLADTDQRRADVWGLGAVVDDGRLSCGGDDAGGAVRIWRDHLRDGAGYRDLGRMAGSVEPDSVWRC